MLRTLDPHSNFFDPKEFRRLREEQHGKYYGVGMSIGPQPRTGKPMVIAPFGGTPAYKAGHPARRCPAGSERQARGQPQHVGSGRPSERAQRHQGSDHCRAARAVETHDFNVVRDEIPRNSVRSAFFVKPGIAYLRVLSVHRNHQRGDGGRAEESGRTEYQGPGAGSAREPRRFAE